jgi:hypothetical protein
MGRRSDNPANFDGLKTRLCRVPFVDHCYDPGGAYWGSPADLWCAWAETEDEEIVCYFRASSRAEAKLQLPGAKFYR